MSNFDMTALNPVLKELIDSQKVENTVYKDNPMFAMVPKNTGMGGKYYPQPIQVGVGQGRSSVLANAQANQTSSVFQEFLVTPASDYAFSTIDRRTLLSAKTDKMAFVNAATNARDSALRAIKNSLGSGIFRSGTGSIGKIASIASGVVTLVNALDIVQIELNMTLQANATDGGTPRAALGYVTNINRALGQFTVSATAVGGSAGTPSGWAAADFILVQGDANAKIKGLDAWIPFTDPTNTPFFGVDRTTDRVRLAGVAYDGSAQTIEEGIQDGLNLVSNLGDGSTDIIMTNPNSLTALIKSLGSKVSFIDLSANAQVGFRGVEIQGPRGMVKILADRNCPAYLAYALQMDTWQFLSVGEAPALVEEDGLAMLRSPSADSYELRFAYYGQLSCSAPSYNGVFKLSA